MIRLVTRGRLSQDYAKGLLAAPEDREAAVRKLIEGAGGKVVSFYFTTGDADFMLVTEAAEAESIVAALLATVASGSTSNVTLQELGLRRNSKRWPKRPPRWRAFTASPVRAKRVRPRGAGLPKFEPRVLGGAQTQ